MAGLRITLGQFVIHTSLNDSKTAKLIRASLPFNSKAQVWGAEVYFATPVTTGDENGQPHVPPGTVAYWPPGKALCLFFGQKPYSPVNVIGEIQGDASALARVKEGEPVRVETA